MKDKIKNFLLSLLSRKFLLALIGSAMAYNVAIQDNLITQPEVWSMLTPMLAFIGVEGAADYKTRSTNIPKVEEESPTVTES
jgi:hypothetical protein